MLEEALKTGKVAPETMEHFDARVQKKYDRIYNEAIKEGKSAEEAEEEAISGTAFTKKFDVAMFNRERPFYGTTPVTIVGRNKPGIDWQRVIHKGHPNIYEPLYQGGREVPVGLFDNYYTPYWHTKWSGIYRRHDFPKALEEPILKEFPAEEGGEEWLRGTDIPEPPKIADPDRELRMYDAKKVWNSSYTDLLALYYERNKLLWKNGLEGGPTGLNSIGKLRKGAKTNNGVHELNHSHWIPQEAPKFFECPSYYKKAPEYFTNNNGLELAGRGTQLKSFFGLKKNEQLTPEMIKFAKDNFVRITNHDNDMQVFLDGIKDFEEATRWLNKWSLADGGFLRLIV